MTIAGAVTLLIVLVFACIGMKQGLVRKLSGVLSVIIAALLVNQMLPYVTQLLRERTPVYDYISSYCEDLLEKQLISRTVSSQTALVQDYPADQIRELLRQYGLNTELTDSLSDSELRAYAGEYLQENAAQVQEAAAGALDTLSKVEQTQLIKELPIPEFLKKMMINFNNSEGYKKLGVTDFAHYLTGFIASILLNIAAFIVTMLVTWVIIRAILGALQLFSRLPVIGLADRIGGLIAGALEGLFVVWVLFLIISLLSGTEPGMKLQAWIDESFVLEPICEANIFLKIVSGAVEKIF